MVRNGKFRWSKWILILVVLAAAVGGVRYFKNDHTEVLEGLKERDPVITAVKLPAAQAAAPAPAGPSPFGGPGRMR